VHYAPAPTEQPPSRVRARPQQARSRARIASVLAAAERVLVSDGAAAITTTRVAAEAGVAIGTVYHYLPDREAILHALALQYMQQFEQQMDAFAEYARLHPIPDVVGTVVDAYTEAYRSQPALRALWFGGAFSEETSEADRVHKRTMAIGLQQLLVSQGFPDDDRLRPASYAAFLMADAVIQAAFREDPDGDQVLIDELKLMLRDALTTRLSGAPA
jgi:AcrR family transcriptional regulator